MIFNLYKQRGETPLECIHRFVDKNPDLENQKMTYLGRLDPMAEGVMLVASGEVDTKQKRREEFLNVDKEYDFIALFGFATDSYDVLGEILETVDFASSDGRATIEPKEMDLIKICKLYEGEREQKYPKYSSVNIKKITHPNPLLLQEREPKKITIYKLQFKGLQKISNKELFGRLLMDISKVKGDFRQAEILELWKERLLHYNGDHCNCYIAKFSASVSSGTYIRSIVNDMGNTLGLGATTLSIKRTRVGDYKIEDSLKF